MVPELTISDFPGDLTWAQRQAAQRIISRFNGQRETFPFEVAKKIVLLAKDGLPYWKKASTTSPVPHKYYRQMFGPRSKLKQRRLSWEKWWVLAAIYGHTHPRLWPAVLEFRKRLSKEDENATVTGMQYPGPIPGYESDDSSDDEQAVKDEQADEEESLATPGTGAQKDDDGDGDDGGDDGNEGDEGDEDDDGDEGDDGDGGDDEHGSDEGNASEEDNNSVQASTLENSDASMTPAPIPEVEKSPDIRPGRSASNPILLHEGNSPTKNGPETIPGPYTRTPSPDKKRKWTPVKKSDDPHDTIFADEETYPRERAHAYGITHADLVRRLFSAESRLLAIENDRREDEEHRQGLASRVSTLKATVTTLLEDQQLLKLRVAKLEARGDGIKEIFSLRRALDTVQSNVAEMDKATRILETIATGGGTE